MAFAIDLNVSVADEGPVSATVAVLPLAVVLSALVSTAGFSCSCT